MELLDAAHRHPLNTQSYDPLGAIPRDAFGRLWEAIGDHVAERLCAGRGVLLPSLGTVTVLKQPSGFPGAQRSPAFLVDRQFAAKHGATQFDPKPVRHMVHNHPYAWAGQGQQNAAAQSHALSFAGLARVCGQSKDRTRRMYDIFVRCIGQCAQQQLGDVLPLPPLGEFRCEEGQLHFLFSASFCERAGVAVPPSPRLPAGRRQPGIEPHGSAAGQRPRRASAAVTPPSSRSSSRSSYRSDDSPHPHFRQEVEMAPPPVAAWAEAADPPGVAPSSPHEQPKRAPQVWAPAAAGHKSRLDKGGAPVVVGAVKGAPPPTWWVDMKDKIEAKAKNVRTLFRHFDADKNGSVDRDEFFLGLRSINIILTSEQMDELMHIVDEDGMGDVDYNEFARRLAQSDVVGIDAAAAKPKPAAAQSHEKEPATFVRNDRVLTDDQRRGTQRLCRILDVFAAFDKQNTGTVKDFDVVMGMKELFDAHVTAEEAQELIRFLNKGGKDAWATRVDFTRAYMSWERLCSLEVTSKGIRDFIEMVPMFRKLADPKYFGGSLAQPKRFVKKLASLMQKAVVAPDTVIINKGEVGDKMYFLVSGRAEVLVTSLREPAVAEKEPGSFFGESALLNSEPRNAWVRAKTECELYTLSKGSLEEVLNEYPELRAVIRPPRDALKQGRGRGPKRGPFAKKKVARIAAVDEEESLKETEIDKLTLLKSVPLFQAMPDTFSMSEDAMGGFIRSLEPLLKRVELPKGRYIVREGDFGDAMFFIAEGRLDVVSGVSDASEFVLHQGNCFGELALLFRERRNKSVRSASPVVIYRLSSNDFASSLAEFPEVSENLVYMAEQRRLQAVRGGYVPEIFARTAKPICDDMIAVVHTSVATNSRQPEVPAWQLRTLLGEILPLWPRDAVDWLLAGGAEPIYMLNPEDRKLPIDYNRVLLPKSIQLLRSKKSQRKPLSTADVETWRDWKRLYSNSSERHYYWHGDTKTSCWEPPAGSPWAHDTAVDLEDFVDEEPEVKPRPAWWGRMKEKLEAKAIHTTKVFRKFDADHSGTVDYEECYLGLQSVGVNLSDAEFEELLSIVDADGSGEISYLEFAEMLHASPVDGKTSPRRSRATRAKAEAPASKLPKWWKGLRDKLDSKTTSVKNLFRSFDVDKNGTLSTDEFVNGLRYIGVDLSETEFEQLLEMVDSDGSGEIDYLEFSKKLATADDGATGWFGGSDELPVNTVVNSLETETFNKLRGWVSQNRLSWDAAFRHFRRAQSGDMNADDFQRAVRVVNSKLSEQQMAQLMRCVDRDGSGTIGLEEWVYRFDDRARSPDWENGAFRNLRDVLEESNLSLGDLIRRADTSADGSLSVSELARAIMGVGSFDKEEATDMAHATDTERTGNVVVRVLQAKLAGSADTENDADWQDRTLNAVRAKLLAKNTPEDIALSFSKFDLDGDGSISRAELGRGMNAIGIKLSTKELDHLMDVCDEDGDGQLDFNEFVTKVLNQQPLSVDELKHVKRKIQLAVFDMGKSFKDLFDAWNVTRSGYMTFAQFKRGVQSVPALANAANAQSLQGIFVSADKDEDGYLTYAEFAKFFDESKKSKVKSAAAARASFAKRRSSRKGGPAERSSKNALQSLRDKIFKRKVTLMEVFRSFDEDYDGFISQDEFLSGLAGESNSVAACLGDLKELGLSYEGAAQLYQELDKTGHGFVNYESFCELLDEKLPPDWEERFVDDTQKILHKRGLTSEELFDQWNYRNDGAVDVTQFSKGVRSIGLMKGTLTDSMCQAFFNLMDEDGDGVITIAEFNEKFSFRVARFDWEQNAMQVITKLLMGNHATPFDAFVAFQNRSMRRLMRPMDATNFQRYFDGVDAVLALRLKKWEWKKLFHTVDKDMDGTIGERDFCDMLTSFNEKGRVGSDGAHEVSLSSSEVFRRADSDCDGFLDRQEFEEAARVIRPSATPSEMDRYWRIAGGAATGRVDVNGFAKVLAAPTEESWQMSTMEDVGYILRTNRGSLKSVFDDIDQSGTGVLSMDEFREAMNRLGLALSRKRCDSLHRRIDVNSTGGIKLEDLIGWASGSFVEGPLSDRTQVMELTKLHLGSAENLWLWIQKKFKLQPEMSMNRQNFARGIKALRGFLPGKRREEDEAYLEEALREMFAKAGGRNGIVTFTDFLEYFTPAGETTFEATLPVVVEFLSVHRTGISNVLGKRSRSNAHIRWREFRQVLEEGWGGPEGDLKWDEEEWEACRRLADPSGGVSPIEYKPLLNRCYFRYGLLHSRDSRKSGRIARKTFDRTSVVKERTQASLKRRT